MLRNAPLVAVGIVVGGVFLGHITFATKPEVGEPRPVQQGVSDVLNNSSWNQVAYIAHEWWLGEAFDSVSVANFAASETSRGIIFMGELKRDNFYLDHSEPTLLLDWLDDPLMEVLLSHRITSDGHLIYCKDREIDRWDFCQFNVFADKSVTPKAPTQMLGVDLGPFGVGLVEESLLDRLSANHAARNANSDGLPQ